MKIKVTKEVQELEGIIEEKVATPFGTSAHINVGKAHTGKVTHLVIPNNPEYEWVLSKEDLKRTIDICNKVLNKQEGQTIQLKRNMIKDLNKRFTLQSLHLAVELLGEVKGASSLATKIKKTYKL